MTMSPNEIATILFHPADRRLAEELAEQLRSLDRKLRLELEEVGTRLPMSFDARPPLLVLATAALLPSAGSGASGESLRALSADGRALVLANEVRMPKAIAGHTPVVDVTGFNMAHLADELTAILNFIRNFPAEIAAEAEAPVVEEPRGAALMRAMLGKVDDLPLAGRTKGLLRQDNVVFVGDLVMRTEVELLMTPSVGRATLTDIKRALAGIGLRPGLHVPDWPPEDIEGTLARLEVAERVGRLEQAKGGARFEPAGDRLAMVAQGDPDDRAAASRPMTRQMHQAALEKARGFDAVASRLDNQPGWTGIGRTAANLVSLLDRPAEEIPDILGYLYPAAIELGSFLELDTGLTAGAPSYATPLDAEVRRPLGDLLRTLAPWLRAFPSVRDADDEASRFLLEAAALRPAIEVVDAAERYELLRVSDLAVFRQLEAAARRGEFQGGKAGGRTHRSATNLVISAAAFAGSFLVGAVSSDYATTSPLVHKIGQFLTHSEVEITALVEGAAPDLRHAIEDLVGRLGDGALRPEPPPVRRETGGLPADGDHGVKPGRERWAGGPRRR